MWWGEREEGARGVVEKTKSPSARVSVLKA
jgi:hypothetical protein